VKKVEDEEMGRETFFDEVQNEYRKHERKMSPRPHKCRYDYNIKIELRNKAFHGVH
jgi:hypothetical protein